ncbi:MAG TPA: autotransporter-associated beta strand repeat-containing protein, partial [Chthoniobacteraceae bacterium]
MNLSPALSPTSSHRKAAPRFRSSLLGGTSIAVCLLALARPAGAADGTWTRIATGGLWSDTLNWTGGIVADGIDAHANFGTLNITTDNLVQFDAPRTLGSLTFADVTTATAGSWILSPNSLPGTNVLTLEVSAGSPTITVNGLGAGKVAEIATNIAGVSGFTKAGAGQLVLSGANAYSGPTNVSVGTLRFAKQVSFYNSIPANQTASNLVVSSGATAAFNVGGTGEFTEAEFQTFSRLGTDTGGFLAGSNIGIDTTNAVGPVTLSAGLANPNANLNTLGLAKLGIGTLIINTANTYTGATNVNGGVLRLETNGVINGGAINVAAVTGNQFVVDGGTLTSSALSTINQAGTNNGFLLQSGSATFNGGIRTSTGADGSLIKITGGTFTATDVSVGRDSTTLTSFATGFVVQGGTVNIQTLGLGTTNSLGHGSFEGGTTTIQGAITVGRQSSATGSTVRGGALRVINAGTSFISQDAVDGIIIGRSVGTDGSFGNGSQTADVRFTGGTSTAQKITFQYDSNLTGTGALHVNGGALYLGAGGIVKRDAATGQAISINLTSGLLGAAADWATSLSATTGTTATNNITIKAADQLDAAHNITMGAITGSGGFTKTGGGALIVGGNSTYSGATTISEGTLQVGNGGTTGSLGTSAISNNGTLAFNRTDTALVFANNVTGTGALQHNGTGTTTLTGAGNTYTGNTTINAGTLRVTTSLASPVLTVNNTGTLAGAGPITGAVTVNSGGRLTPDVAGSTTGTLAPGTLTVGALTLASGSTLDFDFSSLSTFDKIQVTNPDSLIINGAGLNLFASNTADRWTIPGNYNLFQYSGALGGTAATNLNSALSVLNPEPTYTYNFSTSGGFITLSIVSPVIIPTWNSTTGGSWNTAGNWTTAVPNGQDVTAKFGNKITAPSTVTLDGNKTLGVLEFGSANSYTIAQGTSGTLTLSKASGNAAIDNTSGSHTISAPVNLASSTVATVFDAVDSLTISGSVSGANALTKSGLGTLVLAASNSYAGGTALTAGTLQIKTTDALSTGSLAVTGVATLQLGADNLTPANSIVLSPIAATIDTQANTATLSGAVSGDGALNKIGSGKLVLTAANTYTGATTISGGILSVPSLADGGLPSPVGQSSNAATNLVLNGGTLEYTGADSTTDRLFRLGTGGGGISSTGAGAVQFLNTGAITLAGSNTARTLTLSGTNTGTNILAATLGNNGTGATSLVKSGPGTWVLSGENTFNGSTVITGGILTLQNSLALGGSTLNYNNQGGLVDFGTLFSITLGGLAGAQNLPLTSAPALTIGGNGQDTTYSGSLTGANGLTKAGSGRLILSGANELAGTVTVSGGTLEVPTGGSLVTPGNISVSTSSALFHQTGGVVNAAQLDLEQGG